MGNAPNTCVATALLKVLKVLVKILASKFTRTKVLVMIGLIYSSSSEDFWPKVHYSCLTEVHFWLEDFQEGWEDFVGLDRVNLGLVFC